MLKLKKAIPIFAAVILAEAACFLFIIHNLKQENEELMTEAYSCIRPADTKEYYLNDGLYYLNGDINSCYFKIEDGTFQLIVEEKKRFEELYKIEITDIFKPDNTHYVEFDEWFDRMRDTWSVSQSYYPLTNVILSPDTVDLAYHLFFLDNSRIGAYSIWASYIDHDNISCPTTFDREHLIFTRISN